MWSFETRAGTFFIRPKNGGYAACFEDEELGWYATAQMALDDLAGGHTFWPSCGDPSRFDLPTDLSEWTRTA